jgi:hypothetical protein
MRPVICTALLFLLAASSSSEEPKKKREPDPLMAAKLKESQKLLEALALNKLDIAQKSAEELLRISKEAQFRKAVATAKYEYHANTFQKACETVIEKAKGKEHRRRDARLPRHDAHMRAMPSVHA